MKCNKAQEWINLQMDGQLPAQHVPMLQEHLGGCADCRLYCDDVLVGRRLLVATEPVVSEHFDWKLQLRLNQAMREAARDAKFPWSKSFDQWRVWLTRAGASAAVGLAAVLALSLVLPARTLFLPDQEQPQVTIANRPARLPFKEHDQRLALFDNSRRPLDSPFQSTSWPQGLGVQRQTSAGGVLGQRTWQISSRENDLARIRHLEQSLEAMRRLLSVRDRHIQLLEAKLDSQEKLSIDKVEEN